MVAIFIFVVGILSFATLMASVNVGTDRFRRYSTATLLASDKLEDLNRYSAASTADTVQTGGSLTTDQSGYYDDVQVQSDNGSITVVTYNPDAGCYDVFTHTAGTTSSPGTASDSGTSPCITSLPATLAGAMSFHRRWLVENPITLPSGTSVDVHRVTVLVTLWSPTTHSAINYQGQPVTFKLSTVRP